MVKDVTFYYCNYNLYSKRLMPKNKFKTLREAREYAIKKLPPWGDMDNVIIHKATYGASEDFPIKGYAIEKSNKRIGEVFHCGQNGKISWSEVWDYKGPQPQNYYLNKDGTLGPKWKGATA